MNKKGYTLTYTIIIIGLLLILTASIIMITFFNFQFARRGGEINTSFYVNDGALEEALTELSLYSYNAEIAAWEYASGKSYITDPIWISFLNDLYANINGGTLTLEHGNALIASAIKGEFEQAFFNHLYEDQVAVHEFYDASLLGLNRFLDRSGYTGISLEGATHLDSEILTAISTTVFKPTSIVSPSLVSNVEDPASISLSNMNIASDGRLTMTISSDGTYHDYHKKISVDLTIDVPDYSFSSAILTESIALRKNEITDQVLLAKENLVFADGISHIDGNIYGYGSNIDFKYNQNRDVYGGVIVGYKKPGDYRSYGSAVVDTLYSEVTEDLSAQVNVSGDLASRNSLKIETSNSSVNVGQSTYANNVYIRSGADDTSLNIYENMYNYSDLFIAGDQAKIVLNDDTFTHESLGDINTYRPMVGELWGLYSLHPAAGSEYTRTGTVIVSEAADNPSIILNGLFLAGVIRFDVYNESVFKNTGEQNAYKTGESFTTYKNKAYYQSLGIESIYQSGIFSFLESYSNHGLLYDLISFYHSSVNLNQPDYRGIHFYTTGYNAYLDTDDNTYKDISNIDKNMIKLRDPRLDGDEFYGISSSGLLQFANASIENSGKVYHPDRMDTDAYLANLPSVLNDVDPKVNLLGYADLSDIGEGAKEVNLMDDWLDLSASGVIAADEKSTELAIYNDNPNLDIYLNFDTQVPGQINLTGQINQSNETFSGTIVTEGNIYIFSDSGNTLNFRGNMISGKNIYIVGSGQKNFIHDEIVIYQAINRENELKTLYQTNMGRRIIVNNISTDVLFEASVINNPEEVNVNQVAGEVSGSASIIDSNTIQINSWTEKE